MRWRVKCLVGLCSGLVESTEVEGFICNRAAHWFAIRKINGLYWNLDSMKEKPEGEVNVLMK